MSKSIQLDALQLGLCYYPEQWSDSLWEDDFRRMKEMNLSHIRIGEFAWSIFEPQEGVYDFDLFDRVLDLAQQYGLSVIMGTPTATPPAWLTQKYPEVLNVSIEGVTYQHGMRRHYNYSSPKYQELCATITRQMANHFKDHPAIIGWQIDNELNCEVSEFYAEADHISFRQWVQKRYHTLEALNQAWGTVFWSQTYTDWEQVYLPRPTVSHSPNPHHVLDEKRFISDNTIAFARIQADILREVAPHQWITTNGLFGHLDSHALTEELLDFFSYDSYPQFSTIFGSDEPKPLLDRKWSQNLSVVRNISNNFCVMEQQAGPGGWVNRMNMPAPRPGQLRLWTYQSVLHGADLVMYFRWRTATFGTEIYWHGLNDYHNQPNRRIAEASQVGQEFVAIGNKIASTTYQADIAIVKDYDNDWDGEYDIWHGPLTAKSINAWFKQLQYQHIPTDIIYLRKQTLAELQQYKVLIYPHAAIMSEQTATLLTQYVQAGGTLILGARTGYKELSGHCRMAPMPGPVASLCGISVADFTSITGNAPVPGLQWQHTNHHMEQVAQLFNDILQLNEDDVEVLATYTSSYYEDAPALTQRPYGQGKVLYYGAAFHEDVVDELLRILEISSPVAEWLEVPEHVEIGIRQNEQNRYIFLLNYSDQEASIHMKEQRTDVLTDTVIEGSATIPAYGVMILE